MVKMRIQVESGSVLFLLYFCYFKMYLFFASGQTMSFSLWTTTPRFPKLHQRAGRKCLQLPLFFSSESNSLSVTFLLFCKCIHFPKAKHSPQWLYDFVIGQILWNICHQTQSNPSPVLPSAQERPPGGQAVLPWRDSSVPGRSCPADRIWRLHAWG